MIELLEQQKKLTTNQLKLICTANLADLLDFFDFFLIGYVTAALTKQWSLTYWEGGGILLASGLGAVPGAFFWGWLGDKIGRCTVFIMSAITISLATGPLLAQDTDPHATNPMDLPELDPAAAKRGVEVGDVLQATDGDDLFGSVAASSTDPFTELATAFVTGGALVRVPAGVTIDAPIVVVHRCHLGAHLFSLRVVELEDQPFARYDGGSGGLTTTAGPAPPPPPDLFCKRPLRGNSVI